MGTLLDVRAGTSDYAVPAFGVSNRNGEARGGPPGRSMAATPAADLVALASTRRRPALRRAALRATLLPGLALLSWLAWDSAPPHDWLRPVGPALANTYETGASAGLELVWDG